MGFAERHNEEDCECVKYKPFIRIGEIRLNGINLLCRKCNRYVDPAKWKGGILKFQKVSRYASANQCPCCGRRLSINRRNKKALENSVMDQVMNPKLHDPRTRKTLKKKVKLLESNVLAPRVS